MLAWIDIETTGLNPRSHYMLEVALVITDNELEVVRCKDFVLPATSLSLDAMDDYVRGMHSKSGLLDLCLDKWTHPTSAELALGKIMDQYFPQDAKPPMCGSTVSFDRGFIDKYMPLLGKRFHYRNIDVSTIKELSAVWAPDVYAGRPSEEPKAHRALTDVLHSIEELRYYRATGFIGKPDPTQENS